MKKIYVKMADTPSKREKGLMFRKNMEKNEGMLFSFPFSHRLSFWMKNTYIPLDIAFIDDDGKIFQIEPMHQTLSPRGVTSSNSCRYALEVNAGWFKENSVKVGDYIKSKNITPKINVFSQVVKKPDDKKKNKKDLPYQDEKPPETEIQPELPIDLEKPNAEETPEIEVEGDYPESIYAVPYEEGQKPEIDIIRDNRGKIKFAEDHNVEMEILYWTKRGHMLPPRRVRQVPGEGYPIKSGPSGDFLVAFDVSPTIQGQGWSIKGGQPKSFILDNIVQLQLLDAKGNQMTDEQIDMIKNQENPQQAQQPQQPQQPQSASPDKQRSLWDKIRNVFKGK